jgi:hypothetical protein
VWHSIKAESAKDLRYLAIDCFGKAGHFADEPTFDEHVKVLCREQGWDYDTVVVPR